MERPFVFLFLGLLAGVLALPHRQQPKATCGYASCPQAQPGKLNVHLVPHTHDDVGWLKTVDQYYYGSRSDIQFAGVQYIIDSVVDSLLKDPNRRFIYVETAFFWKWWVEQTPERQEIVKMLVNDGRLEFIGGGWSMNDEATTHYQSTIDQFTWGLRRLNDSFGACGRPRIGWQIDPFGHAKEVASIMSQITFDGLFFARLDYQDKNRRLDAKEMELIWETSPSLGNSGDLFTGALYNFYTPPGGFCFDVTCRDDPIIDNPDLPDYNVPQRVNDFVNFLRGQQERFASNNIILTMGTDFSYQYAEMWYKNLDKLIKATNERNPDINAFYSTPSCYVKSVNEANVTWTTKQDDFFPYASNTHTYWTGYFTSRPTLKGFERQSQNLLQIGKQLAALAQVPEEIAEMLVVHKEAQGILQHHDAVAGTEKQHVADDYARILQIGVANTEEVINNAINEFLTEANGSPALNFVTCPLRNISECSVSGSSSQFLVTIYNPLSRPVNYYAKFPVGDGSYTVRDPNGNVVESQAVTIPDLVAKIPGRSARTTQELIFDAELPPLGYRTYYISKDAEKRETSKKWKPKKGEEVLIGDEKFSLKLDAKSHFLKQIIVNREIYDIVQTLEYYIGALGDNSNEDKRSSGAYIFRPDPNYPNSIPISDGSDVEIIQGSVLFEVHQVFADWASQIIRHYENSDIVEIEYLVGPIPIDDGNGKEVITKFISNLKNNGKVMTDTSGRDNIARQRDQRPTWNLEVNEPVAGNYYPVVSDIWIDNSTDRISVVTDRAQGGGSITDGSLEVMVHRRLLHDDAFGAGEAINETAFGTGLVVRGKHYSLVGPVNGTASSRAIRLLTQQKALDSIMLFADVSGKSFDAIKSAYTLELQLIQQALPESVQILTLEPWKDGSVLLRLENIFTTEQQAEPVTVDISNLFNSFTVVGARETTLAGNMWLEEASRLQWRKQGSNELTPPKITPSNDPLTAIKLGPKQIRTFVLQIQQSEE